MKSDADHLPERNQTELDHIQRILLDEFAAAIATATKPHKRNGKVYKIILFGSYARDDWVDEPENGYQSDYDLLVVVSHADLTEIADYWYVAEDRILRDAAIARPVNIIVHSLEEVNQALSRGEYFWVDIARDGIALYDLPCHALATPKPLTPADAYAMAQGYRDFWMPLAIHAQALADISVTNSVYRDAAFMLHQAAERAYACFLLVHTLYFPRSHNIKFLRSIAEDKDLRLIEAWQRESKVDRRRFELLKRAYVEARYSPSYAITADDLDALAVSVERLRGIVETLCRERLDRLREAAAAG
ncbi:putative nucleotidyltransferase [Sphingomonas sp. PP-CE-3G-477]|uniref:HEPN domain-containing protein n=1 Tax=Sphingomonas sp. PP-CE-3G-477 TaxID=2135660 RepID=UPI000D3468CA|nr:HEPN domain-containing protein [Sphingomonas sp. PP-CE-3G-477]PTQ62957.1 putative nucleotidyltransferase [Sphingomonas sp. PP-CE-3G-477]